MESAQVPVGVMVVAVRVVAVGLVASISSGSQCRQVTRRGEADLLGAASGSRGLQMALGGQRREVRGGGGGDGSGGERGGERRGSEAEVGAAGAACMREGEEGVSGELGIKSPPD